jgi:hypothetical protein
VKGRAEAPATAGPEPVWTKTKIIVCTAHTMQQCRGSGCQPAAKAPTLRIDIANQTLCGIVEGTCRHALKLGEVGFDGSGRYMVVHALGFGLVIGVEADGSMTGAEVRQGRVIAIHGRCTAG